jgi:hypothetical protein
MVKPDVDTLPTVPDDPPAAGPDRALDPPPPELLLAAGELLEVALTIPEEQPATAIATAPTTMDLLSLREKIRCPRGWSQSRGQAARRVLPGAGERSWPASRRQAAGSRRMRSMAASG